MSDIWPTVPPADGQPNWPESNLGQPQGNGQGPSGSRGDGPAPPARGGAASEPTGFIADIDPTSSRTNASAPAQSTTRAGARPFTWRRYAASAVVVLALAAVGAAVGFTVHDSGKYLLFSVGDAPVVTADPSCRPSAGSFYLPGGAPCVRLQIPGTKAHKLRGRIFMVDVEVGQASPLDWAEWQLGILGSHHEMAPVVDYSGNTPPAQLACQDAQQMQSANEDAALAALTRLGYRGTVQETGAQVYGVIAGTPASQAGVQCGDVITAVNSKPVNGPAALTDALAPLAPGTLVHLDLTPSGSSRPRQLALRLGAPTRALRRQGFTARSFMGVQVEPKVRLALPFPVSVNAGDIGGSSAGLAFTLAILDTLTNGNLTGGHFIGATGTIAPDGQVGDVSGVREKTVAVQRAGAQAFFVPQVELSTARSVAGPKLAVYGVTSLDQVLNILHTRYGGSLPGLATSSTQ